MVGISTMADIDMIPDYAAQMESFQRSDDARQKLLAVRSTAHSSVPSSLTII